MVFAGGLLLSDMSFLYLASRSPRRRELLKQAGIPFRLLDVEVDESVISGESALNYVERLAQSKAIAASQSVLSQGRSQGSHPAPVLAADTTVAEGSLILGKPADTDEAINMLLHLSGKAHSVHTGIAICHGQDVKTQVVSTTVRFASLSRDMVERYVATGEPMDKAGGYGIQGFGGALVEGIEGSYSNVVGLPIRETVELVAHFGVPYWQ